VRAAPVASQLPIDAVGAGGSGCGTSGVVGGVPPPGGGVLVPPPPALLPLPQAASSTNKTDINE